MKKNHDSRKRLTLDAQTLRALDAPQLVVVSGGQEMPPYGRKSGGLSCNC